MKFRNKETGEIYDRWNDIPCDGKCWNCPASFDNNKYKILCSNFFRKFPHEAAAVLGCEVIEDDAPYSELPANHPIFTNNHNNYQDNKTTVGWISVKDRFPENNVTVLAYCGKTRKYFVGNATKYHFSDEVYWRHEGARGAMYTVTSKVTHWMPLPEPPKEKNQCSKME